MTLPVATDKTNTTATNNDHPAHHNALGVAVNEDLLRAALAPSTPVRAFDTTFQPFPTRPGWCSYTLALAYTVSTALTDEGALVELLSDAADPPTTVRASAQLRMQATLIANINWTVTGHHQLSYLVPAGHNVRLRRTVFGAGTATLLPHQVETVL